MDDAARRRQLYFHIMATIERHVRARLPDVQDLEDAWGQLGDQDRDEIEELAEREATMYEVQRQLDERKQSEVPAERPALVN